MGISSIRTAAAIVLAAALVIGASAAPRAAVVTLINGKASGITGLVVGSDTYDISFDFGTYATVFPANTVFPFPEDENIIITIVAELNSLDDPPQLTSDGVDSHNVFSVPEFFLSATVVTARSASGGGSGWNYTGGTAQWNREVNTLLWAVPTVAAGVPVPAALPLFGSAIAFLGLVAMRRASTSAHRPQTGAEKP